MPLLTDTGSVMRRFLWFCWLVCLPLAGAAQSSAPSRGSADPQGPQPLELRLGDASARPGSPNASGAPVVTLGRDYRLAANDLLEVEVLDAENLKRTVRINAGGFVTMPLIGPVQISGLTQFEAENRIAERYRERYLQNPQVSIFIREVTTERITIEGAVVRPGIFPLVGQLTLLRALAMAGGFAPIANSTEVVIMRTNEQGKRQIAAFDVERIRAGKDDDPVIRADDLIVVQRDNARRILKDSLFRDIVDSINPFSSLGSR